MSEEHSPLPWSMRGKQIYDANDEFIGDFQYQVDAHLYVKSVNAHNGLVEALEIAMPYIESQNNAEGMLDGFSGRKPRRSDNDLEKVKQALKIAKGI